MTHTNLSQEWQTLQQCHEQHERNALHIKLSCIALCVVGHGLLVPSLWLALCVLLMWALEAIFKTYQARLVERLLRVEKMLADSGNDHTAMQLHTEWIARRVGVVQLIAGYINSACKPTVAFPYAPMLVIGALVFFLLP